MIIEVINKSRNDLPEYKNPGDSGMDIRADLPESVVLRSGKRVLIKTGLFFNIPQGYEFQIRSRSGLALKYGVIVLNSPGTIDSGYHDELGVILYNSGDSDFTIEPGDRIAQLVLAKTETIEWSDVEFLSKDTQVIDRNGGFGHSGIK